MVTDFHQLIDANRRNSWILVAVFVVLIAIVAGVIGTAMTGDVAGAAVVGGAAMVISLLISLASYYGGASMILAISRAREIRHDDDPQLFNVVEEMSIAGGVPMPKVYVIDDSAPNAFATGRDPAHGVVAITTGLRSKLTRDELQGVIAHEFGHIRNYDIRYALLVAVMVGTIVMLADFFLRLTFYSGRFGSSRRSSSDRGRGGGGGGQAIMFAIAILLAIIAPLLAKLIQMAVSRQREYLADATAVELTRYPLGLANALRKIASDPEPLEVANRGTQHLYIVNPLKKASDWSGSLMATHPPIEQRINRLLELAHEYPQQPGQSGQTAAAGQP